jgi:hypothetical protein
MDRTIPLNAKSFQQNILGENLHDHIRGRHKRLLNTQGLHFRGQWFNLGEGEGDNMTPAGSWAKRHNLGLGHSQMHWGNPLSPSKPNTVYW